MAGKGNRPAKAIATPTPIRAANRTGTRCPASNQPPAPSRVIAELTT
jgi:hypothetical protein